MADSDDHEEDDSNMSNVAECDQGGSDSGAGATSVLPVVSRKKQRKMLAIVLVVVLIVGGGVWAWMTHWREPEPPQTLCDGRISSREITATSRQQQTHPKPSPGVMIVIFPSPTRPVLK